VSGAEERDPLSIAPGVGAEADRPPGVRSLWHRIASSSIALWGSTALGFLGTLVAARALGPTEYGKVALALGTATLIASLLDLTLEAGVVHHGSRALADQDIGELRGLLRGAMIVDFAIGIVICGAMVLLAGPIADAASAGHLESSMIRIAALASLAATLDGTTGAVILLAGRPELRAWSMAATNLARLAGVGVAVGIGTGTAAGVLAAYVLGGAVGGLSQAIVAWHVGWRRWRERSRRTDFREVIRKLLPFAVHSSLSSTIVSAADSLILVLLGRTSGPAAVGLFRVARLPEMVGGLATAPIRLVMFPENARVAASGRLDELERQLVRWSAISLAIAIPGAIAGWFLLPWLIETLYGEQFAAASDAARILLVTALLLFGFPWTKTFAAVIGRPQIASAMAAVLLVVALPITLIFAEHGQDAAAAGVSGGVTAMTVGYLWVARRYFRSQREPSPAPDA
jgi:O-antigen/teichoic acid export membrane protein